MSHFVGITVDTMGVGVGEMVAPYDEQIEVDEYEVGKVSDEDKQRFLEFYREKYPEEKEHSFDELYADHGEGWNGSAWRKDEDGEWTSYSTYNPKSKWDWYAEGFMGRWQDFMQLKDGTKTNSCKLKDLDLEATKENPPYCLIIDGVWYERGEMGWFGISNDKYSKDDWGQEVFDKLTETLKEKELADDAQVVVVDFHI